MDRAEMEKTFRKTLLGGAFGTGMPLGTFLASEQCGLLFGNLLKLVGIISAVVACWYMWRINLHKNKIKAIDEARAETRLCAECILGKRPLHCPIEPSNRPAECPIKKKESRLIKLKKLVADMYKEESTKP